MASETAIEPRRLSPEFWAILGSAITLVVGLIGIAALILTVSGWHREDIRDLGAEIEQLDAKVDQIDTRLAVVEVRISAAVIEPEPTGDLAAVVESAAATP